VLPSFVERTSYGVKESNPYNKLFEERIIFLGVQIDDASANDVMAQLLTLESNDPDRDITMYINSPGGSFTALTAIYDTMMFVRPDIATVCMGQAASAAAVLLGGGHPGKRAALEHAPRADPPAVRRGPGPGLRPGDPGQRGAADAHPAGEDPGQAHRPAEDRVRLDIERDTILTAEQAKEYGFIDDVITTRKLSAAQRRLSS
jgi:ATP-dependent Clp protease protease subunit